MKDINKLKSFYKNKYGKGIDKKIADESIINGDEIIKLPDGSLTTMYHYLKNSNKEIEEIISKYHGLVIRSRFNIDCSFIK